MTASQALKIDPDALRKRTSDVPGCAEIPLARHPTTVSFLLSSPPCRLTVYCETGTVAVAHAVKDANDRTCVRQVFRRNVTSLDVISGFLRHPPAITTIDSSILVETTPLDPVRSSLELIEVGVAILHGEREKLQQHLEALEPASEDSKASPEGMEFQFSLPADPMKHVDQCLRDIAGMGRLVKGVSTNGKGAVFLYGNGGVAYTPNIPRALYHKLSQLRKTKDRSSRPSYVSLGTRDRFFVAFHDGTVAFKGPKGLDKELRKARKTPASVAFGTSYDTFFVVFEDGSWIYQGKGIPEELEEKLSAREDRPDLRCVNLGPSGEWFMRARNGRLWWGGISDEMDESITALLDNGHFLNFLDFGEDGSYFISYD